MPSFFSIRFCFVVFFFVFYLDYLALQALTCSVKTSIFETVLPNLYFNKMNLDFSKFFLDFRKLKLCFANPQTSIQKFRVNPRDTGKLLHESHVSTRIFFGLTTDNEQLTMDFISEKRKDSCKYA